MICTIELGSLLITTCAQQCLWYTTFITARYKFTCQFIVYENDQRYINSVKLPIVPKA